MFKAALNAKLATGFPQTLKDPYRYIEGDDIIKDPKESKAHQDDEPDNQNQPDG